MVAGGRPWQFRPPLPRRAARHASARGHYLAALDLQKRIVEHSPANLLYQNALATTYFNLSFYPGGEAERRKWIEQALELRKKIVAQEPTSSGYRRNVARTYDLLGANEELWGHRQEAVKASVRAADNFGRSWRRLPASRAFEPTSRRRLQPGASLGKGGFNVEARDAFLEARSLYKVLLRSDPENSDLKAGVKLAEHNLAEAEEALAQDSKTPATAGRSPGP